MTSSWLDQLRGGLPVAAIAEASGCSQDLVRRRILELLKREGWCMCRAELEHIESAVAAARGEASQRAPADGSRVQRTLFEAPDLVPPPRARRDGPGTSRLAASSMRAAAGAHRQLILSVLAAADHPLAAEQIAARLAGELTALQVMKRLADLQQAGAIVVAEGRLWTNESGRAARTYLLAAAVANCSPTQSPTT